MATHSSVLAWRIPGMAEPGGLPSMESHRVGHDWSDLAAAARRPIWPSITSTEKRCPFHHRGLGCKSKKSRDTWSNRQIWPWDMEWSRAKANKGQENTLVIVNTLFQQHKRQFYMWTSPDGHYQNQIDYILCSQRWRSSVQSAKTRPEADRGLDHDLLITKFTLKLKKVGTITRTFRNDLNQIPYNYTVEVTNRFKG